VNQIAKIEVNISEISKFNSQCQAEWKERVKEMEEKYTQIVGAIDAIKSELKSKFASIEHVLTLIKQEIQKINEEIKCLNDYKTDFKSKTDKLSQ
jgi:septation ring formation regulator EzrA